jgi:hypothetical protein
MKPPSPRFTGGRAFYSSVQKWILRTRAADFAG